jgi:tetratricopeptide (TPR) repeat protein
VTTELLFKKFYEEIAKGHRIGEALENARRTLFRETTRHTKRFGEREVVVKLQDWFIPSLYQTGGDVPLLQRSEEKLPTVAPLHNVPALQEVGFFGRAWELWELEQWLLRGTRRVTISGFGGQGKTYLASELARWLLQKHWFERAVFVSYQAFQGVDAVGLAVSCCAEVCQVSLLDADAVTAQLSQHPTLLILDNVESVTGAELQKLLSVAAQWSEVGETRVLVTTRPEIVLHPAFPTAHSERHRLLHLAGLQADDAVNYLQRLLRLPPETKVRAKYDDLVRLLWVVRNHPLSIPMIAQALRTQRLETVEARLRELTVASPDNPVVASLQLSLEKLDAEVQQWLPLLGVFEGGALQKLLLDITELSDEQLSKLQSALYTTGLIHPIPIAEGYIYLQFHPTLAPVLWSRLDPTQQTPLRQRYQQHYYQLSSDLYFEDNRNPLFARAIVKQELSNLLAAVKGALADGSDEAVEFVEYVNRFLGHFGLQRDRAVLTQQAATLAGVRGSDAWYLSQSNQGQQLFDNGRYAAAATLFAEMLETLGAVSYQRCTTLGHLGRCLNQQGQAAEAITCYQQVLVELEQLEQSDGVIQQKSIVHTDLADALAHSGQFEPARQHYEQSLAIADRQSDYRQVAVVNGQLGMLVLMKGDLGDLAEAERRYQTALELFQQFHEPLTESVILHQLGYVYQAAQQWDAAEMAYRRAAHLSEAQGQLRSAATTWNQLAMLTESMGKWTEAEAWFRKVIEVDKQFGNAQDVARHSSNLAGLLQNQPERLTEARQLAEQALVIKQTLDPAAATIWTTCELLAQIAEKQGDVAAAKAYRRLSREAKLNYAGTRYELEQYRDLILAVVQGGNVAAELQRYGEGYENLAQAIRQILAGERDAEVLCEPLNYGEAPIVLAILAGLAG